MGSPVWVNMNTGGTRFLLSFSVLGVLLPSARSDTLGLLLHERESKILEAKSGRWCRRCMTQNVVASALLSDDTDGCGHFLGLSFISGHLVGCVYSIILVIRWW